MSKRVDETGKVIEVLRKGPRTTREITEEVVGEYDDTSRRRIHRRLKELDEWGLVERKEGKFYWHEYVRFFNDVGAYERSLRHSKKLIEEAKEEAAGVERFGYRPLRNHARTGYPEVDERIQKAETLQGEVENMKTRLKSAVVDQVKEHDLLPVSSEDGEIEIEKVSVDNRLPDDPDEEAWIPVRRGDRERVEAVFCDAVVDMLLDKDRRLVEQNLDSITAGELRVTDGSFLTPPTASDKEGSRELRPVTEPYEALTKVSGLQTISGITGDKLSWGIHPAKVEKMLESILESQEINRVWRSCREKQEKLRETESSLDEWFYRMGREVEHGTPLKGGCSLCPKVN